MERKTITRWFWVWQFEKEEEWLNEMAANGWVLESVGFCKYTFVRCEPGEYTVRTEMHPYDDQYVKFMEETGAEYVGRMMMWIYFRKKTEDGVFDLYSDIDSKISHLDRIGKVLLAIGGANLIMESQYPPWLDQSAVCDAADVCSGADSRQERSIGKRTGTA